MRWGWILEAILGNLQEAKGAAALSLDERGSRVADALRTRFGTKSAEGSYSYDVWPVATYDDYVIFRKPVAGQTKSGLFSVKYEWTDEATVDIKGEPVAVVQTFKPAKEAAMVDTRLQLLESERAGGDFFRIQAEVGGPIAEAEGVAPSGREWDVLLIREGMSKNRNHYGRKVLAEAAPLYENRPMFIDHKVESGPFGRSGTETVGFTKGVRGVLLFEGEGKEAKVAGLALTARACLIDEAFRTKLLEAHSLGNPTLFGLSHDVRAESVSATRDDGSYYDVTAIRKVESTDWVLNPAAGGRVTRLVASDVPRLSLQENVMNLQQLIEALKAAGVTVPADVTLDQATILLNEALARDTAARVAAAATTAAAAATQEATRSDTVVAPATLEAALARLNALEAANLSNGRNMSTLVLDRCLAECSLPDVFKTRIRKRFEADITAGRLPTEDAIVESIRAYVEDVGALREANLVLPHVGLPRVEVQDRSEVVQEQLAKFFDPTTVGTSFKEIYVQITGDTKVTGKLTEGIRLRLSEALGRRQESLTSASFDQILGDSITRRMLKDYAALTLANWRNTIAEVVPLNDFRTVRRLRFGGYGNLPIVAQSGPYTALTSPTDEEATYAPSKRGGTEQITLEMIKNDDVGVIRRIPGKLSRSAGQTLHEFVWDLLANNGAIYDAVALVAVGHTNIVTTALSASNISSLRLKIKQQTDMSNAKRLGLMPRYLIVPGELEELAFQLTTSDKITSSANNDPNFIRKLSLETIVVEYWTDTNNYFLTASVDQAPMLEIGFLDGQEQPELFVADSPTVGSMFSNDQLTWKLRHIYGGAVMDFRPFAGAIVA